MEETSAKKSGCMRRIFTVAVVTALTLFFAIPSVVVLVVRQQVATAVKSATAMRLEEHSFRKVLATRTLAPAEFSQVIEALPITVDYGIPGVVLFCFIPHHRVVITGPDGKETALEICFSCAQVQFGDGALVPTPAAWRQPLRQLFLRNNIPIQDHYGPAIPDVSP